MVKGWLEMSTFNVREKLRRHLLDMKETLEKSKRGKANIHQLQLRVLQRRKERKKR